ncbi:restriction endonuclease [Chromobacterium subtsugae]|uniref:restriction endonuclease n=1 Tax=Chromobacterium subtsugae TaxID=251747 RepID=UPI000AE56FF3|nr:restriction endonuclease [Chromobacterium subtsugae]
MSIDKSANMQDAIGVREVEIEYAKNMFYSILNEHRFALARSLVSKSYIDKYGVEHVQNWDAEVNYFLSVVVEEKMGRFYYRLEKKYINEIIKDTAILALAEAKEIPKNIVDEINYLIEKNKKVLENKYRKLVYFDEYGNLVYEKFSLGLDEFVERTILSNSDIHNFITERKCLSLIDIKNLSIETVVKVIDLNSNQEEDLSEMSGEDFEDYCARILIKNGWDARVTKKTGDQGVDIIARFESVMVVFQCKKYSQPVGNKAVQEVSAGKLHEQADFAAVVSNAAYTNAARELARTNNVFLLHYTDLSDFHEKLSLRRVTR